MDILRVIFDALLHELLDLFPLGVVECDGVVDGFGSGRGWWWWWGRLFGDGFLLGGFGRRRGLFL